MNALEKEIRGIIAAQGAISMAAYMELALQHPQYGYYRTREPLGKDGDFITSPEVSQMFGEMVGIWCVEAWHALGSPEAFALVECGPGHGTMMKDLLRATAKVHGFSSGKRLYLVDTNETLRACQKETLKDYAPQYLGAVAEAPDMPMLVIANEFFDAFPVRQFEKTFQGWAERMVGVEDGALAVVLRPLEDAENAFIPPALRGALPNAVFEFSPSAQSYARDIARALASRGGAGLIVDYGYAVPSGASTLQAVSRHACADIFERPGEIDLTAHVDFGALAEAARAGGAEVSAAIGQGEFLQNCGIEIRAESLKKGATTQQAAEIESEMHRLIDDLQMGTLFKAMELGSGL